LRQGVQSSVFFFFCRKLATLRDKKIKNGYEDTKAKISEKSRKFASFRGNFSGTRQF
jgi:hypothetical protein